jgi:hypothetical protein
MIRLHQYSPMFGIPNASPAYCERIKATFYKGDQV